ncbi:MAG: PKD domain-containing protein [Methanoregula sp.]|nr:PKD domain-containing protein [Methanoregula sp.]
MAKYKTDLTGKSLGHARQYLRTSICIALLLLFAALVAPVSAAIPVADFTSNVTKGVAPLAVQFNDTTSNHLADCWNWSFGDGTAWVNTTDVTLKDATHIYTTKGWYSVTLIANNTEGSNQTIKTQYINVTTNGSPSIPVADFTSNVTKGVAPLAVQFNDTSSNNPDCWNWSFGDGTAWVNTTDVALKNATHTYTTKDWYSVTLIANNTDGSNQTIKTQYINVTTNGPPSIPVAEFTSNVTKGVAPLAVQFNDTSSNNPDCWNWSFGDGTAWVNTTDVTLKNATHTYSTKGWYSVTLIVNNTDGSNQMIKTQYVNAAANGATNSTNIAGIAMVTPSWTSGPYEPRLDKATFGSTLSVSGDTATVTNPSQFFSNAVFNYDTLHPDIDYIWGNSIRSVQLNTTPFISNLASFGPTPTTIFMTLNLSQYSLGDTVSILMSDAPSASDRAAFIAVAGTTQPLENLSYEMDITTTSGLASNLSNANIYFTVPIEWVTTYPDNIRLFRIHGSPPIVSMLNASLKSTTATTATYWATTDGFSRFSPGAIGTVPPTTAPTTSPPTTAPTTSPPTTAPTTSPPTTAPTTSPPTTAPTTSPPTTAPTTSPPTTAPTTSPTQPIGGGDSSDSGGGGVIAAPVVIQPKAVIVPKVEPPKELPKEKEPDAPLDEPAPPAVSKPDVPAPAIPAPPAANPATSPSFGGTVASSLQEGGARAAGFVTGDRGSLPADDFLPPRAKPLGAVAAGVAMAGAVALAGSLGATASGGLLGTLLGQILAFFQHLFKPVTDFFSDRLAGHAEDHAADLLERQHNPLSRSLDASRNPLRPHYTQILILGTGAALYGLAFVIAERAGMLPVVVGTYILVSGVVVVLHELAHYFVARHFVMKSELKFSTTGLLMTFFSAWFFGNVFSQPLTTKIEEGLGGDKKTFGLAMIAGPLVSLAFAAAFALLIPVGGIWTMVGTTGLAINLVQIVFSLIPVKPLDGEPVFTWNRLAWVAVFVPVFAIYLLAYLI